MITEVTFKDIHGNLAGTAPLTSSGWNRIPDDVVFNLLQPGDPREIHVRAGVMVGIFHVNGPDNVQMMLVPADKAREMEQAAPGGGQAQVELTGAVIAAAVAKIDTTGGVQAVHSKSNS